jgi:streptogramin lyase
VVFVLVAGVGASGAVAAPTLTEFALPTANSHPRDIVAGPDGNLWFAENFKIGRITPTGTLTEFPLPGLASGITAGPDGNLWFAEQPNNKIGRITPAGVITEFTLPTPGSEPTHITAGPDGNLWFAERIGNAIGRITPTGVVTEFPVPTAASQPFGIAAGPDGNLWFTEIAAHKIGRITPTGTVTEFALPIGLFGPSPRFIAAGPDGNLWFTEIGLGIGRITPAGVITEFPLTVPPIVGPQPYAIAAGPDGNLWFTEYLANRVAQITPAGTVTEFPLPPVVIGIVASNGPGGITTGPDGNIWFTEVLSDKIGRLTLERPAVRLDHFQCYRIDPTSPFAPRTVTAGDQFGVSRLNVLRMTSFCAPVRKNREPAPHNPRAHLACYLVQPPRPFRPRVVVVTNQFERAARLTVATQAQLCLPSGKSLVPSTPPPLVRGLDHYECYGVKPQGRFASRAVLLVDQFGKGWRIAFRATLLCNPVSKNKGAVLNPRDHLVCYALRGGPVFRPRRASVRNQFGVATLVVSAPTQLCVPSVKA